MHRERQKASYRKLVERSKEGSINHSRQFCEPSGSSLHFHPPSSNDFMVMILFFSHVGLQCVWVVIVVVFCVKIY
jgi:hypothetical protein